MDDKISDRGQLACDLKWRHTINYEECLFPQDATAFTSRNLYSLLDIIRMIHLTQKRVLQKDTKNGFLLKKDYTDKYFHIIMTHFLNKCQLVLFKPRLYHKMTKSGNPHHVIIKHRHICADGISKPAQ